MSTYYVATTGSDTTGNGTVGTPWATLDKALSKSGLTGGDTILLAAGSGGSYATSANTDFPGAAGNPITIQGAGIGQTILSAKLTIDQGYYLVTGISWQKGGVTTSNADSVIIDGCELSQTINPVKLGGGFNCIVRNCDIHHGSGNPLCAVIGTGHLIENNTFHDNNGFDVHHGNGAINCTWRGNTYESIRTPNNTVTTSTSTVTFGTGEKVFTLSSSTAGYAVEEYLDIWPTSTAGGDHNTMRGWVVSYVGTTLTMDIVVTGDIPSGDYSDWQVASNCKGNHADTFQAFGAAGIAGSYGNVVERCRWNNCTGQFGNFEGDGYTPIRVHDWTFRNLVFYNSRIQMNVFEGVYGFKYHNCTVYNTSGTAGFGSSSTVDVYNCIFSRVGNISSAGPYNQASTGTKDYNLISMWDDDSVKSNYVYNGTTQINEEHGINTGTWDPYEIFTDPDNGDLTLKAGSPAINAGTDLSAEGVTTDFNGAVRTAPYSMGAYTYGTPGAPTFVSATVPSAGTSVSVVFSASCTTGAGGAGGMTLAASGGAVTLTYASGSGSTTYVYNASRTILSTETITGVSYTQPGAGIAATTGAVDVETFADAPVTNNSTQVAAAVVTNRNKRRFSPMRGAF